MTILKDDFKFIITKKDDGGGWIKIYKKSNKVFGKKWIFQSTIIHYGNIDEIISRYILG